VKGKYNLLFTDKSIKLGVDLLVSANRAWSKVYLLLITEKPFYTSITAIEL
jgi:hypothetical protein